MFVAHYKSTSSSDELYTKSRDTLDFPTQILYKKKRYLLNNTYLVNSESHLKNIYDTAEKLGIPHDIPIE